MLKSRMASILLFGAHTLFNHTDRQKSQRQKFLIQTKFWEKLSNKRMLTDADFWISDSSGQTTGNSAVKRAFLKRPTCVKHNVLQALWTLQTKSLRPCLFLIRPFYLAVSLNFFCHLLTGPSNWIFSHFSVLSFWLSDKW